MTNTIETLTQEFDGRSDFRAALKEMRSALRSERQFLDAMRVGKVLRNRRLFESVYAETISKATSDFLSDATSNEFGDGEFAKWLIEWFSNGGWQTIIEFIKQLIPIFTS